MRSFKIVFDSHDREVEHYRINQTDDSKLTVEDKTHFEYLTQLVKVGRENRQSGDYDKLPVKRAELAGGSVPPCLFPPGTVTHLGLQAGSIITSLLCIVSRSLSF